ncbi:MAG: HAD family phosphatase [Acidobacteria bacterium]|nr:HAD family phosphatase [Acidobacteriota bacterium]MBK8150110.1 HAD family phosphatase [Acidobacteriota bacterium]MBK8811072.1 HAD family phosphatase [Acidobacteriota bacterium]
MIKLLALDLDGTLLDSRGAIPIANKRAIRRAEEKGVLVTIATGRRFRDARPVALEIGFNAPIVTHNGAMLKFAESLETVDVSLIATETVREILRVGRDFGGDALISADPNGKGTMLYDVISAENIPLQKYVAWSRLLHGDEAEEAIHHVERLEDALDAAEVIHVSFSGHCSAMFDLERVLEDELGETVNILATIYPHLDFTLLDILPPNASKATGVHKLAMAHGFSHEEVMVCGDNFNDLEMLEYAGTSVVMGNASPELKDREEFFVTANNDENGVAAAIERFILRETGSP